MCQTAAWSHFQHTNVTLMSHLCNPAGMSESQSQGPLVTVQGVQSTILHTALSYLYGLPVELLPAQLLPLLAFADMLGLESLHTACQVGLWECGSKQASG